MAEGTGAGDNPRRLDIRKYPNRRYYDTTRSRHLTLEEIHAAVRDGCEVRVVDSRSGEDITAKVLAQIIIDLDPPKLSVFPVPLLHSLLRANQQMVGGFVERYFNQPLAAFLDSQRNLERYVRQAMGLGGVGAGVPTMADWTRMMWGTLAPPMWGAGGAGGAAGTSPTAGEGGPAGGVEGAPPPGTPGAAAESGGPSGAAVAPGGQDTAGEHVDPDAAPGEGSGGSGAPAPAELPAPLRDALQRLARQVADLETRLAHRPEAAPENDAPGKPAANGLAGNGATAKAPTGRAAAGNGAGGRVGGGDGPVADKPPRAPARPRAPGKPVRGPSAARKPPGKRKR